MERNVYTISTPTRITDLYISDRNGSNAKRLTRINDALFSAGSDLTEPDGLVRVLTKACRIQVTRNRQTSQKISLILNIHGGPHAACGYVFDHEFQWMAAKGYVVVYPNPRGSTSYGQSSATSSSKYPGDDHQDLMLAVDEVIKRGYIDGRSGSPADPAAVC